MSPEFIQAGIHTKRAMAGGSKRDSSGKPRKPGNHSSKSHKSGNDTRLGELSADLPPTEFSIGMLSDENGPDSRIRGLNRCGNNTGNIGNSQQQGILSVPDEDHTPQSVLDEPTGSISKRPRMPEGSESNANGGLSNTANRFSLNQDEESNNTSNFRADSSQAHSESNTALFDQFLAFMQSKGLTTPFPAPSATATSSSALPLATNTGDMMIVDQDSVVLDVPEHTGYSDEEEQFQNESFSAVDSRQEIANDDSSAVEFPSQSRKLDSEFSSVIANLHTLMGDDLSVRQVSSSCKVKSLSQLDTDSSTDNARPPAVFPHSQIMLSSFDCIHETLWGTREAKLDDPDNLPSSLSFGTSRLLKRKVPNYNEKFYGLPTDQIRAKAPDAGSSFEVYAGTKETNVKVNSCEVRNMESLTRRCLLAINAIDVLIGGLRRLDSIPNLSETDNQAKNSMFNSLSLAVKHASEFASCSIASSMIIRRQGLLNSVPEALISPAAKKWLVNQPLIQKPGAAPSLFGEVVPTLQKYTARHNKLHPVPVSSYGHSRGRGFAPSRSPLSNLYASNQNSIRGSYSRGFPRGLAPRGRGRARGGRSRFPPRSGVGMIPPPQPKRSS